MKKLNTATIFVTALAVTFLLGLVAAANAGDEAARARADATAVGVGIATGGTSGPATASGSSGDNTFISIPGNSAPGLSNVWRCSQSTSVGLGPLAYGWTDDHELCTLVFHKDEVCLDAARFQSTLLAERCKTLVFAVANYGVTREVPDVPNGPTTGEGTMIVQPVECTLWQKNCPKEQ